MYGEVSKREATRADRTVPQTKAATGPPEGPERRARAATSKMTDSAPNETIEERLARVETKTDLVRQDLNEFMGETRSGFGAVRADMREMEVRLCKRQDEATATLRAELKDATDGLRKEFHDTTDGLRKEFQNTNENLHHTTVSLRKEIQDTTVSLRKEIHDATESVRKETQNATESLTKEFQRTAEKINTGMAEVRGYLKGLYVAIVPLTIAVLGLMVHLILRS